MIEYTVNIPSFYSCLAFLLLGSNFIMHTVIAFLGPSTLTQTSATALSLTLAARNRDLRNKIQNCVGPKPS